MEDFFQKLTFFLEKSVFPQNFEPIYPTASFITVKLKFGNRNMTYVPSLLSNTSVSPLPDASEPNRVIIIEYPQHDELERNLKKILHR